MNSKPFQSYRFSFTSTAGASELKLYEIQPVTCHDLLPSGIEFQPNSYCVDAKYQEVTIHPTLTEFTGCTISPALPAGLTLNPTTCTITGKATVGLASTVFTVSSTMVGQP